MKNFLKSVVIVLIVAGFGASCTASGKLKAPPSPVRSNGTLKPPPAPPAP